MVKINNVDNFFKGSCKFFMGATKYDHIKESYLTEVAFIGRSNVGKSSLINALVGQKIALTSKTPGRTRQLNFFELSEKLNLVDMPGYGYAKVGKQQVESWEKLSYQYFSKRANLRRVFLLLDSRRGLGDKDKELMNMLDALAVNYQIVLTKIDELKPPQLESMVNRVKEDCKNFPALHPSIITTSSNKSLGMLDLKKEITNLIEQS
jgi:GTP-binding protein